MSAAAPLPYDPPQLTYTYLGSYLLTADFTVTVGGRTFTIPAGTRTDLATTPRLLWMLLPPTGIYEAAAVAHDWWCSDGIRNGELTSRQADDYFRDLMGDAGVGMVRRWCMWAAVRVAAPFSRHRRPSGWLRDAPLVGLIAAAVFAATGLAVWALDTLAHLVL